MAIAGLTFCQQEGEQASQISILNLIQERINSLPIPKESEKTKAITLGLESQTRVNFENGKISNDFVGTAFLIVTETTGSTGWFSSLHSTHFTKRFSYFLKNCKELVLRELNPQQTFNPTSQLVPVSPVQTSYSKSGPTYATPTLEAVQRSLAAQAIVDSILFTIGEFDISEGKQGNEIELTKNRGLESLGIVNIANELFPH